MKYITVCLAFISFTAFSSYWQTSLDVKERLTYLDAVEFDSSSGEAGFFWTQRVIGETRYEFNQQWSVTGGLLSALQEGVDESPVERNNLDLYSAFVSYKTENLDVRLGRQTIFLGSQRLIGWREGTNVRRAWQGISADWHLSEHWKSSWFGLELIRVKPNGVFNDDARHENRLAGTYHTLDLENLGWGGNASTGLDLYYLYTNRDNRRTVEGVENQLRHSFGFRYFGELKRWYWDWEGVVQTGRHGQEKIEAWTFGTKTGFRFDTAYQPELLFSANIASGDTSNGDGKLETFDALFPRGDYFSGAAILGPSNFFNAHIYLIVNPNEQLRMAFDINFYKRLETEDGVYGPPGNIIAAPNDNSSREVNLAYSTSISYQLSQRLNMELLVTYSRPREFLRASGADDDTLFIEYTINWKIF